jgi:hypothetical protein
VFAEGERISELLKKVTDSFKARHKETETFHREKLEFE